MTELGQNIAGLLLCICIAYIMINFFGIGDE